MSYADLEKISGFRRDVVCNGLEGLRVADLLKEYVYRYASVNATAHSSTESLARDPAYYLLVTDGHHHPLVRQLVSSWAHSGRPVALIPEGVIHPVDRTWPVTRQFFITNSQATRFVLCEAEERFWLQRAEPRDRLVVTGYMGDTSMRFFATAWLAKWRVRAARAPFRNATCGTILVSIDVFLDQGDLGVRWLGAPTSVDVNRAHEQLVTHLLASGFFVIAKCRDRAVEAFMRRRYAGLPVMVTSTIPWQALLGESKALVTLNSSIGREAIELGSRVFLWRAFSTPSQLELNLQRMPESSATIAFSLEELSQSLEGAVTSPPKGFVMAESLRVSLFGDKVEGLRWVRNQLEGLPGDREAVQ